MALAGTYGTRITAYVALTDPTKTTFNTWFLSYRCQLLHGVVCGDLKFAFYVVVLLHKITYAVHVLFISGGWALLTSIARGTWLWAILGPLWSCTVFGRNEANEAEACSSWRVRCLSYVGTMESNL
jgi:hypothetical protein